MGDPTEVWWKVRFRGNDGDRRITEVMGVQAHDEVSARKEAIRIILDDFGEPYPEIYSITRNEW